MEKDSQIEIISHYLAVRKIICEATLIIRQYLNITTNNRGTMLELENQMYQQLKNIDDKTENTLTQSMRNLNKQI